VNLIKTFQELFTDAHKIITKEEAAKEAEKVATLRVGSSGALVGDAMYVTQCGRLAQARYLGFQSSPTEEMRVMFNGGTTLEGFIKERLKTLGLQFRQEETYKTEVIPGIFISGRPDFEVNIDGEVIGIEVKSLASPFSVIKHAKNKFPYMKHLIQSATYMTILNRNTWMVVVGWSFHVNQNGQKLSPSLVWYEMGYNEQDDYFWVKNERNEYASLPFTKKHIIAYYVEVKRGVTENILVQRPYEKELKVDTYNRCKYCPMQSACNEYDVGQISFDQWLARILITKESE
jgi:hypothetical protein